VNNTDDIVFSNNTVNTTDGYDYAYVNGSGGSPGEWHIWMNFTGETTPLHLLENILFSIGTHQYILNSTGFWVWANYSSTLISRENIVDAAGSHDSLWNSTTGTWMSWANYTGNAGPTFMSTNLSVINPNPGNGTHSTNYLDDDPAGLSTSVDVTYINFTTPPAEIPGDYSDEYDSTHYGGPSIQNISGAYATTWANASGEVIPGHVWAGQYELAGDYFITRAYLIFNTSDIPDEAVISSAYVRLVVYEDDFTDVDFNVTIQQAKPPVPHNPMVSGDYNKGNFPPSATYGNRNITGLTDDDWFNISLNASGLLDISKTGNTSWVLRSDQDLIGDSPGVGVDEWIGFYGPGGVTPEYAPHLIVNYTVPPSNWQHIVNLTFYTNESGAWTAYNTTHVTSNGTVTAPAPAFNAVDTYYWNCSWNSNHTNFGNSSVFEFETILSGGGGGADVFISSPRSLVPTVLVSGFFGIVLLSSVQMRRKKREE